jgi:NADH-quinone oxidoreductase subunit N
MLTAAIAAFVYLRIAATMFMPAVEGTEMAPIAKVDLGTGIVIGFSCALTIVIGVAPGLLLGLAERATLLFIR